MLLNSPSRRTLRGQHFQIFRVTLKKATFCGITIVKKRQSLALRLSFFAKYYYLCNQMGKFLTILLFYLCSTFFVQGADSISVYTECDSVEFASRYQVQIDCQRQCNNFAHRTESITVPTTSVTTLAAKGSQARVATLGSAVQKLTISSNYNGQFSLYPLCGRRAIDYYLYTLCQLRL